MKLLACIAFHYKRERIHYLKQVIDNLISYQKKGVSVNIVIHSNEAFDIQRDNIEIIINDTLSHPFHLTWLHREYIKNNIDNYDVFMYLEDDMLVPYEAFENYLVNFALLWPNNVPSFVRIEQKDGIDYVSDIPAKRPMFKHSIGCKEFNRFEFPYNYHAFWIMPQKELKETMKDDFVRLSDGREFAAMYVGWELQKTALVELENDQISKSCYSYHLPNNYALGDGPNGKI